MKLSDMKISTQLRLGLGLILLLVLALGAMAWNQADRLWQQTDGLYGHPLTVRGALSDFESDVLRMHRSMKDVMLADDEAERAAFLEDLETQQASAFEHLATLHSAYLGPAADVESLHQAFEKWNAIRAETIRILQAGNREEAIRRTKVGNVGGDQVELLTQRIATVNNFARSTTDQFYASAMEQKEIISRHLGIFVAVILVLALAVAWLLARGIRMPINALTAATEHFRQGHYDVRLAQTNHTELGRLAASFNTMAAAIQTELKINEIESKLAGVMLQHDEIHGFSRELLKSLLEHTGSQLGAVYFLNEAQNCFEHFESIGLQAGRRMSFSATAPEGELAVALATGKIQHLRAIPADTRFAYAAVSGEFLPREILTIPVLSDGAVVAVISLATICQYDELVIRMVNDLWSLLTARVNGVLAFRKVQHLALKLDGKNHELEEQQLALATQADELTEQNTELEIQKRQLDQANRLKSAFLSNMSHELRTPLNSVIALAGVLNRKLAYTIPAEEYGYLEIIERNGKNLLELINDILDLSRIESGREEVNISRFSVRESIADLVAVIKPQAREKGILLLNQVPADLPPVASDPTKFRHILQNIIGNAVKFTDAGQVVVSAVVQPAAADPQRSEILISISDTGIGIAADQIGHIFDEFRQADASASRKYGGTGLGLAIAKKYAHLLGGHIAVQSTPGKGSTFVLRLPLQAPSATPPPNAEPVAPVHSEIASVHPLPPASPASIQGTRILVVEDSEPAVIQLVDILTSEGYQVDVARNGNEALASVADSLPNAMILDLMMPGTDGFQVLKAIREAGPTEYLPVLILTAKHVTCEELSFLKTNHIHQLIQKGDVNRTDLLAAVARMVAPLRTPETAPQPPKPHRRSPARPGKPMILVVEDNPDNMRTANALLAGRFELIEAVDGPSGLEMARTHQPDLILMDIALPGMDGIQVLGALRQDPVLQLIPVVAATASAMKGDREGILAHGFDGYLSKPLDFDALMKTLRELLYEDFGD